MWLLPAKTSVKFQASAKSGLTGWAPAVDLLTLWLPLSAQTAKEEARPVQQAVHAELLSNPVADPKAIVVLGHAR
jgi:hypothetical protein